MIDLDAELFAEKIIMALVFEIDANNIYTVMVLINQDIIILSQIVILMFKIRCLRIVICPLIPCLLDIVTKD